MRRLPAEKFFCYFSFLLKLLPLGKSNMLVVGGGGGGGGGVVMMKVHG